MSKTTLIKNLVEKRPQLLNLFLDLLPKISALSTCKRSREGCLITDVSMMQILSYGYNGNYAGGPNSCDFPYIEGGCGCIHAEENALLKLGGFFTGVMFCTSSPCPACTKAIVNKGLVAAVIFREYYRIQDCLSILEDEQVEIARAIPWGTSPDPRTLHYQIEEVDTTDLNWGKYVASKTEFDTHNP